MVHICISIKFSLKQIVQDHMIAVQPGLPQDKADSQDVAPENKRVS